ncbi:MAG: acyl-protein synthetase, partial [Bacillota bacterium]
MTYEELLKLPAFSLNKTEKESIFDSFLINLTKRHVGSCGYYRDMLSGMGFDIGKMHSYYDIPFLPVSLFKELDLMSIDRSEIFKTMTSSGTTGQAVSKIYLDRVT